MSKRPTPGTRKGTASAVPKAAKIRGALAPAVSGAPPSFPRGWVFRFHLTSVSYGRSTAAPQLAQPLTSISIRVFLPQGAPPSFPRGWVFRFHLTSVSYGRSTAAPQLAQPLTSISIRVFLPQGAPPSFPRGWVFRFHLTSV